MTENLIDFLDDMPLKVLMSVPSRGSVISHLHVYTHRQLRIYKNKVGANGLEPTTSRMFL